MILKETIIKGEFKKDIYEDSFYYISSSYLDGKLIGIEIAPRDKSGYLPEIIFDNGIFGDDVNFEIKQISFGAMSVDDIEKVIDGYRNALDTIKELENLFFVNI